MILPLITRATEDGVMFVLTPREPSSVPESARASSPVRIPVRALAQGEQYRFHVDMRKCIGCKCCVVACNEQNGNPSAINWRRVGEIEGGWYPRTTRAYLSMGCNHCIEPTCLQGCPVDAYTKDPVTGIVLHSADTCIGCQYCTWTCSYGVPQYNPERRVVGKCDMCHTRLGSGQSPACVSACPTGAIQVEIVDIESWRATATAGTAPAGVPAGDRSLSTTRVTLPSELPPGSRAVTLRHVEPEHPHWPLVVMTVLTQLSAGAFAAIWLLQLTGVPAHPVLAAIASLLVGFLALSASTLHLGRPVHAYRALKMWRRSWISREVLLFMLFSQAAIAFGGALLLHWRAATIFGAITAVLGVAGVSASACIYRVPSRPAWNTRFTLLQFHLTALVLGPIFAAALGAGSPRWLTGAGAIAAGSSLVAFALRFFRVSASDRIELQGTARLLSTRFAWLLVTRGLLLTMGAVVLPLATVHPVALWAAVALTLVSELIGRYLFFVTAVPRHMTTAYVGSAAA
jgi:Fe-S-cluster-containing dehydrogenase component/DMSO reductase anchor subunit